MGQLMDDIVSTANHFMTNMQSLPEDYAVRGRQLGCGGTFQSLFHGGMLYF